MAEYTREELIALIEATITDNGVGGISGAENRAALEGLANSTAFQEEFAPFHTIVDDVFFSASTVVDPVAPTPSFISVSADSGFAAFGEKRTTPGSMSFNALYVPGSYRTTAITLKWRTILAEVRDISPSGTLLATGSIRVDPEALVIGPLYIPLYDTNGDLVTLTEADFGATYFAGYIAHDADGANCPLGDARGAVADRVTSYTQNVANPAWAAYSTNPALAFELVLLDNLELVERVIDRRSADPDPCFIVLPSKVFAVVGRQTNIYFDSLITGRASDYQWMVDVTGGTATDYEQLEECFRVVPTGAGTATVTIQAINPRTGKVMAEGTTTLEMAAAAAGAGSTWVQLNIGDSTTVGYVDSGNTATAAITTELLALSAAEGGGGLVLSLIGTKGPGAGNVHEGVTGQTVAYFYGSSSPFYYSGAFDFSAYMADHSFASVDEVRFLLGINDMTVATSDADAAARSFIAATQYEVMITSIHAFNAATRVVIEAPTPPSASQDAFGNAYDAGLARAQHKRNMLVWARVMRDRFAGREADEIYFEMPGLNLDTVNNMSRGPQTLANSRIPLAGTVATYAAMIADLSPVDGALYYATDAAKYFVKVGATTKGTYREALPVDGVYRRMSDGVHPPVWGYKQVADAIWNSVKGA